MSEKNVSSNLFSNRNDKTVETDSLYIHGHLLKWENVVVQISNISSITASNIPIEKKSQYWLWGALVIGLLGFTGLMSRDKGLAISLLALSVLCISVWWNKNEEEKKDAKKLKCLSIFLNSGSTYSIIFDDESFLQQVLQVFANIFENGAQAGTNYHINLTGCTIDNQSSVVNAT